MASRLLPLHSYVLVMDFNFVYRYNAHFYLKMWRANVDQKIYKSIFIPYQISLDQGFDIQLPGSVKFITAVWMLFIIVISTGYRCDLVSWLAFPESEQIPTDFDMLDRRRDYKVVFNFHAGTSYHYFNNAKSGLIRNIRQRFILEPDVATCAIASAMEPKAVCISWGLIMPLAIWETFFSKIISESKGHMKL
ncbi:unnamed protein product [Allacma fusca]|uniref:Uncharacterized protein n=1 Tax=Allacma fusca TaxID=39272 RepID=A0A8J2KCV1_9HEXA|nr:unnamed protein product [Allacma fusca]